MTLLVTASKVYVSGIFKQLQEPFSGQGVKECNRDRLPSNRVESAISSALEEAG